MSIKMFARNSGAGNGCANFMGAWKNCVLSAGKPHVHRIVLVLRGEGILGFGEGGACRFYFYGREAFSEFCSSEVFWRNDRMAIARIGSTKHATETIRKQRATTTKLRANAPKIIPLDDRQITHLICVRIRHLLYYLYRYKTTGRRPKTPPKKSYSRCFRRAQIR